MRRLAKLGGYSDGHGALVCAVHMGVRSYILHSDFPGTGSVLCVPESVLHSGLRTYPSVARLRKSAYGVYVLAHIEGCRQFLLCCRFVLFGFCFVCTGEGVAVIVWIVKLVLLVG